MEFFIILVIIFAVFLGFYINGVKKYKEEIIDLLNQAVASPQIFWGDDYEYYLYFKREEEKSGANYELAYRFIGEMIFTKLREKGFSSRDIDAISSRDDTCKIIHKGIKFIYDNHYLNSSGNLGRYHPDLNTSLDTDVRYFSNHRQDFRNKC